MTVFLQLSSVSPLRVLPGTHGAFNPSNKATQRKMLQATRSWPHAAALWAPEGVARPLQPWIWAIQPDYPEPGHLHP